ncbi:helix-turn-helix domain-containing protein [Microbacterium sp. cx-59]|uniref:helix-turn-helix domain-containing protein n=1 Tax=Microbacterium sp. cx-59 TaxID=2891207 RepID=UPI001E5E9494|nr:helix-turn-helix domain-containing protein [Microbacterium sp. cx-59]MCC4908582.1 helix-turn-helix domain-containing protein [Microbacterium sp. cx-59]
MPDAPMPVQIGERLRRLRQAGGRSLASVAGELGISSSALSQIETGAMQPSVKRLVELVGILGAPVSAIFQEIAIFAPDLDQRPPGVTEPLPGVRVAQRADDGAARLAEGVTYRRLSPMLLPGVDWFESTYPPRTSSSPDGAMLVHSGLESGRVERGELTFEFTDGAIRLGEGASISFTAALPHRVVNETDAVAVATWITVAER